MSLSKVASVAIQVDSTNESTLPFGLSKWQLALLIGTPVVIGGAAYWYFSSQSQPSSTKATKKKTAKTAKIKPSMRPSPQSSSNGSASLPPHMKAKAEGNAFFQRKDYEKAIEMYSEAIKLCPDLNTEDKSVFYQNRAAACEMLDRVDQVIEDCSQAINLNSKYIKARIRRAKAFEKKGKLKDSLTDITCACILQEFKEHETLMFTDRILRQLSKLRAKEYAAKRQPKMPSDQFIKHYFLSFVNDPFFPMVDGNSPSVTLDKLQSQLISISLNNPNADDDPRVNLISGTLQILKGNIEQAEEYLKSVIDTKIEMFPLINEDVLKRLKSNALIKLGSIQVHEVSPNVETTEAHESVFNTALNSFSKAIDLDPDNPDIYIHRAQVYLLMQRSEEAKEDLAKCVSLNPDFTSAIAQKLYVDFNVAAKNGTMLDVKESLDNFKNATKKFPSSADIHSLFGQVLMESQQFGEAGKEFQKAIECDPHDANLYVHKGILQLQAENNIEEALKYLEEAAKVDPKCQFAYEMWGTLEVQRGNLTKGMSLFDSAIECAQTELDCAHLFSLRDAAEAQLKAAKSLNIPVDPSAT